MDWRVLAVAAALLSVLGGGALLAAQTERDLGAEISAREMGSFQRPDSTPLKPNGLKLPKDLPIKIPEGAQVSLDGRSLTLPDGLDLELPDDLDLSGLDLTLPEDFRFDLPEGTMLSPPGLELPNGGTITLPDGSSFKLPAGSRLDLPQQVIDQLIAQGMSPGTLGKGGSFDISGLPEGLLAEFDPPAFDGPGMLDLPPGTRIQLPEGHRFPFAAGAALLGAIPYLLPAGTAFDVPYGDGEGLSDGTMPVPTPTRPQGARGTRPIDTEIDQVASRARKSDPIRVQGHVRDGITGQGLAGRPVEIYLNETKPQPGILIGRGTTDPRGLFDFTVSIPADRPARDYQLVNRAPGDDTYADGWGDPPITAFASTKLDLTLPLREGAGVRIPVRGLLQDETGLPVPHAGVAIVLEGRTLAVPTTLPDGSFEASVVLSAGRHTIVAQYAGNSSLEPSSARASIDVEALALDVPTRVRVQPGDPVSFTARLLDDGRALAGRQVEVDLFPGLVQAHRTDASGNFTISTTVPAGQPPGPHRFVYRIDGAAEPRTQLVEVFVRARIALDVPDTGDADRPVDVRATLLDEKGAPVRSQLLRAGLSGPGGAAETLAVTDAQGVATMRVSPPREASGVHVVAVGLAQPSRFVEVVGAKDDIKLGVYTVRWNAPTSAIRGQSAGFGATVLYDGAPLRDAVFKLDAWGARDVRTDADGSFRLDVPIPADAGLGRTEVALRAAGHNDRTTALQVLAVPKLKIDAPDRRDPGASSFPVGVRVTDDRGKPLEGAKVSLAPAQGAPVGGTTDREGWWRGDVEVGTLTEDNLTLLATLQPEGDHLGAEASAVVPVGAPPAWRTWLLFGIPAALLVAGGVAAGAWWWRRHRARPAATPLAPAPAPVETDVAIAFRFPDGEQPVVGVGEPVAVQLTNRGAPGAIRLDWASGHRVLTLGAGEAATTTLSFDAECDILFTAAREGGATATATLRVVDYRREVAREFDALLQRSRSLLPHLGPRTTPRELQWALEGRLGPRSVHALDDVAEAMEVTNYSHYDVTRAHYLRFVRGARALEPMLRGGRDG